MSENFFKDKGNQTNFKESLEQENQKAHDWVRKHMEVIVKTLEEAKDELIKTFKEDPVLGDFFPVPMSDSSIYRIGSCIKFINLFPDDLLGDVKKVRSYAGKPNDEINHAFFLLGQTIIDPTAQQFYEINREKSPELFEGEILIATPDTINKVFSLVYKIPDSSV